jgi:hypothetical protein
MVPNGVSICSDSRRHYGVRSIRLDQIPSLLSYFIDSLVAVILAATSWLAMVFTKASRAALVEVDANWRPKFILRMVLNVICIFSIICAVYTNLHTSNFKVTAYERAKMVMIYIPCVRATPDHIIGPKA